MDKNRNKNSSLQMPERSISSLPRSEVPLSAPRHSVSESHTHSTLDDDDYEDEQAYLNSRYHNKIKFSGLFLQPSLHGEFARRMEYCYRCGVCMIVSLFISVYPPFASKLVAPFLCPVIAILACGPNIGASINTGWQAAKGTGYASLLGWFCWLAGIGYDNDSRAWSAVILFLFSAFCKYFIAPKQITTAKLAVGLAATIIITQLNAPRTSDYAWQLLLTCSIGSLCGIAANILPFPRSAMKEVEERWQHALLQTVHAFDLIIRAFTCSSTTEVDAKMLKQRIEQTIEFLLANRDQMKLRMKDAEHEFPIIAFRFFCGTYNNYTYERHQQHFMTFDHLYRYLKCMAFSLQTLPYDEFHNACIRYLKPELSNLTNQLQKFMTEVAKTDKIVKRSVKLSSALESYSLSITELFEKYLQFRADMYFQGKLYLIDLNNGRKAVLRKPTASSKNKNDKTGTAAPTVVASSAPASETVHGVPLPPPTNGTLADEQQTTRHEVDNNFLNIQVPIFRKGSAAESIVRFRMDDDSDEEHYEEQQQQQQQQDEIHARVRSATNNGRADDSKDQSAAAAAGSTPTSDDADHPALEYNRIGGDFTWTSEDIISLNFFVFQLSEFTRRSLKFRCEPLMDVSASEEQDPIYVYHQGFRNTPRFFYEGVRDFFLGVWQDSLDVLVWDRRLAVESVKLAAAIILAGANELCPPSWPPLIERTGRGWWAPVAVAFTMAETLGGTVSSMVLRVLGTFVGAVSGYLFAKICHANLTGLVACLTVWNMATTYNRGDKQTGYAHLVAGFTAIVVSIGSDPASAGTVSEFAFIRIEETLIGVIVGMVIHNFIFPQHASILLHGELLHNIAIIKQAFQHSFGKYQNRVSLYTATTQMRNQQQQPIGIKTAGGVTTTDPSATSSPPPDWRMDVVEDVTGTSLAPRPMAQLDHEKKLAATSSSSGTPPPTNVENQMQMIPGHTPVPLDPAHSFRLLGPKMFSSVAMQEMLCGAASLEPTLWYAPFPKSPYQRIISTQRTIVLYLYCMDLALQRIAQSGSMYLMPDLDSNFNKLKSKVMKSFSQLRRKLIGYKDISSVIDQQMNIVEADEKSSNSYESEHSQSSNASHDQHHHKDSTTAAATPHSPNQSASDELLGLTSSLLELESRYKQWIDQRILAKRNMIRDEDDATVVYDQMQKRAGRTQPAQMISIRSNGNGVDLSRPALQDHDPLIWGKRGDLDAVGSYPADYGFLKPIPLDTPKTQQRKLGGYSSNPQQTSVAQRALGIHTPPMTAYETVDREQRVPQMAMPPSSRANGASSGPSSPSNGASASIYSSSSSTTQHRTSSVLDREATAGLAHMDVTFTRSMDVLALNTFLFSTRGLIREIISLSQAVRVLLHQRAPGIFEEEY